MVVEYRSIKKLLDHLENKLDGIQNMDFTFEDLTRNEDIQDILDRRLHLAIEDCISIASHLAAALSLPGREKASDVFLVLGEHGVIPDKLSKIFAKEIVGFRNILVHEYLDIDYKRVFKSYKEDLKDLRGFAKAVVTFLEKNPELLE